MGSYTYFIIILLSVIFITGLAAMRNLTRVDAGYLNDPRDVESSSIISILIFLSIAFFAILGFVSNMADFKDFLFEERKEDTVCPYRLISGESQSKQFEKIDLIIDNSLIIDSINNSSLNTKIQEYLNNASVADIKNINQSEFISRHNAIISILCSLHKELEQTQDEDYKNILKRNISNLRGQYFELLTENIKIIERQDSIE